MDGMSGDGDDAFRGGEDGVFEQTALIQLGDRHGPILMANAIFDKSIIFQAPPLIQEARELNYYAVARGLGREVEDDCTVHTICATRTNDEKEPP